MNLSESDRSLSQTKLRSIWYQAASYLIYLLFHNSLLPTSPEPSDDSRVVPGVSTRSFVCGRLLLAGGVLRSCSRFPPIRMQQLWPQKAPATKFLPANIIKGLCFEDLTYRLCDSIIQSSKRSLAMGCRFAGSQCLLHCDPTCL